MINDDLDEGMKVDRVRGIWAMFLTDPQQSVHEKMVLFWHNHFVIEFDTVKNNKYDLHYLDTLEQYGIGNFKKLLRQITTEPGMLVYLNGNLNNKTLPNENYARELQELFTVGKGPDSHYNEADVKAAAKVLTGWKDDTASVSSYFDGGSHNIEDKHFSSFYNNHVIKGRSGDDGAKETDELLDLICQNNEVSKFLCRKLYRWFVHSKIDEQVEMNVIKPLSEIMIHAGYEIRPVLEALFSSNFFYEPQLIGGLFKSPTDYFIGIVRVFMDDICAREEPRQVIGGAIAELGQNIGNPPSVAGWPAYYEYPIFDKNWISSELLAVRSKILKALQMVGNDPVLRVIKWNFIAFADILPNPGDAKALVRDSVDFLCSVPPGNSQVSYIAGILETGVNLMQPWDQLWASYQKNRVEGEIKNEINIRLHKGFMDNIFLVPEYQVM